MGGGLPGDFRTGPWSGVKPGLVPRGRANWLTPGDGVVDHAPGHDLRTDQRGDFRTTRAALPRSRSSSGDRRSRSSSNRELTMPDLCARTLDQPWARLAPALENTPRNFLRMPFFSAGRQNRNEDASHHQQGCLPFFSAGRKNMNNAVFLRRSEEHAFPANRRSCPPLPDEFVLSVPDFDRPTQRAFAHAGLHVCLRCLLSYLGLHSAVNERSALFVVAVWVLQQAGTVALIAFDVAAAPLVFASTSTSRSTTIFREEKRKTTFAALFVPSLLGSGLMQVAALVQPARGGGWNGWSGDPPPPARLPPEWALTALCVGWTIYVLSLLSYVAFAWARTRPTRGGLHIDCGQ